MNKLAGCLSWVVALLLTGVAAPAFAAQASMQHMDMPMPHQVHGKHPSAKKTKSATKPTRPKPSFPRKRESILSGAASKALGPGLRRDDEKVDGDSNHHSARSADYSDGFGYGSMPGMHMADDKPIGKLLFDRLEYFDGRDGNGTALDAQAWYGTDANKLWLKAEGEASRGRMQDLRLEALWDRPVSAFWDMQLGVRHDAGIGPDRSWAAFGVQGLAPYWVDIEATVYVGPSGRTAFRFESEYELLLTQKLILQPRFEMSLYGRDDPQRGIGSGLSDATFGLRLRYEFTRQFAPYLGLEFERRFGQTARFARAAGESAFDARVVAGLRFWF